MGMRDITSSNNILITAYDIERSACRRPTNAEIIAAFPETTAIVNDKLLGLHAKQQALSLTIHEQIAAVKSQKLDGMSEWFWIRWVDVTHGEDLRSIERDIRRLRNLLNQAIGRPQPAGI